MLASIHHLNPIFIYISAIMNTLGEMLSKNANHNKQWEVYYISKILIKYEKIYTLVEHKL